MKTDVFVSELPKDFSSKVINFEVRSHRLSADVIRLVQRRKWSPTANNPQTGNEPQIGPQMIPDVDRK